MSRLLRLALTAALGGLAIAVPAASSAPEGPAEARDVARYWTAERRAEAMPRDLVFDDRGLAYLKLRGGVLEPYGHDVQARVQARPAAATPTPTAKPGGGTADTTPPAIEDMDPAGGQTIGAAYTFRATVTDTESGVKSVSFVLAYPDGRTQSYSASKGAGDVWSVAFSGFWDGAWAWHVVAKDKGAKGGNTETSPQLAFVVKTSGGDGGGGGSGGDEGTIANAEWAGGGAVQKAAGRIYFELPSNKRHTRWSGYVCSGSVVGDSSANDRSLILTAAHCVYDDANKAFARNVLFIPNQTETSGSGTDRDCSNDPMGCWVPSYGVVDADWATRTWPENIPWDYGFYVVPTAGAHQGKAASSDSLELAAGTLPISFSIPTTGVGASGSYTHALGYSYSDDPNFMYCAQDMTTEGAHNWWLSQCGLSGGSSGGPWIQPLQDGSGPVISVNSWGYRDSPGMAGPMLSGTSAECLFRDAENGSTAPSARGALPAGC